MEQRKNLHMHARAGRPDGSVERNDQRIFMPMLCWADEVLVGTAISQVRIKNCSSARSS
jgi:hypothetical protein